MDIEILEVFEKIKSVDQVLNNHIHIYETRSGKNLYVKLPSPVEYGESEEDFYTRVYESLCNKIIDSDVIYKYDKKVYFGTVPKKEILLGRIAREYSSNTCEKTLSVKVGSEFGVYISFGLRVIITNNAFMYRSEPVTVSINNKEHKLYILVNHNQIDDVSTLIDLDSFLPTVEEFVVQQMKESFGAVVDVSVTRGH